MERIDLSLRVGNETIKPVSVVRDLGVLLDEELTMKQHISKVARVAFCHCQSHVSLHSEHTPIICVSELRYHAPFSNAGVAKLSDVKNKPKFRTF